MYLILQKLCIRSVFLTQAPGVVSEWVMSSELLTARGKGPQLKAGETARNVFESSTCLDQDEIWSTHSRARARSFSTCHSDLQRCASKEQLNTFHSERKFFFKLWHFSSSVGLAAFHQAQDLSALLPGIFFSLVLSGWRSPRSKKKMLSTFQADFAVVLTRWCACWKCIIQGCWISSEILNLSPRTSLFHLWTSSSASDLILLTIETHLTMTIPLSRTQLALFYPALPSQHYRALVVSNISIVFSIPASTSFKAGLVEDFSAKFRDDRIWKYDNTVPGYHIIIHWRNIGTLNNK